MSFLERLARTPQILMSKRSDESDDNIVAAAGLEIVRMRLLEVWSLKGGDAPVPDWLTSSETLRNHLREILGDFLAGDEGSAPAEAAIATGSSLAFSGSIDGVFETDRSSAEILPPDLPFAPVSPDMPFFVG